MKNGAPKDLLDLYITHIVCLCQVPYCAPNTRFGNSVITPIHVHNTLSDTTSVPIYLYQGFQKVSKGMACTSTAVHACPCEKYKMPL